MQIHELNTFSGTLGANDYFATDNGTDTSKISAENLYAPLNARINNIIAGPAPSAQEVIDARLGVDGETYPSLGDAIRGQVGDLKSALSVFNGLFEADATKNSGKYCSYFDGDIKENNQYEYGVFEYDGFSDVIVRTNANSIAPIACYYSGEPAMATFVGYEHAQYPASYGTLSVVDYHLTIPEGTTYIAVNNKPADGPAMLIQCDSVEYTINRIGAVEEQTNTVADNISVFVDITNTITKISGTYYGAQGYPATNAQYESAVIAVEENDLIEITTNGNSAAPCCGFYTGTPAHATWISNEPSTYPPSYGTLSIKRYLITIPTGTKYIAVNNKIADGDMFVYKYKQIDVADKLLSYEGKNILLLGDSITQLGMQARGWPLYFDRIVKANQIDNVAVIGARWCDYNSNTVYDGNPQAVSDEQNVIGNQVQKIINNPSSYLSDYDVVIIAAGTNDLTSTGELTTASINTAFYNNGAVRALADVDRSTWAGATRWATEKLRELFPNAVIVYNTPINRIEGYDSARVKNNADMVRQCAEINSVMLCDSMHCGITMSDSTDFVDGLHPSVQGAKKLGTYNAKWFSKNITEFID